MTGPARTGVSYWGDLLAGRAVRGTRFRGERQTRLSLGSIPTGHTSLNCDFKGCEIFLGIYL